MKRRVTPELLDLGIATPAEVAASLADLRRINRWFGGISTGTRLMGTVANARKLRTMRVLDVGSASADVPLAAQRRLAAKGITIEFTFADLKPAHLPHGVTAVAANALALPFADNSFDVVSSSLLLHHLEPEEAAAFAREAVRVARHAVTINDGRRSWLHLLLVYMGHPLFSRVTRHDAVASVRRAYTPAEVRAMLAPFGRVELFRAYLQRMGIILWKG